MVSLVRPIAVRRRACSLLTPRFWICLPRLGGLEDMRIHDMRHSYASRAQATGESLQMIGRLLGHSEVETTARYAHLAEDSVKESAARVAESIAADLLPQYRAHTPPAGA